MQLARDVRSKLPEWLTLFEQPLYVLHAGFHLGRPCHPEPLHEQELLLLLVLLIGESSLAPLVQQPDLLLHLLNRLQGRTSIPWLLEDSQDPQMSGYMAIMFLKAIQKSCCSTVVPRCSRQMGV